MRGKTIQKWIFIIDIYRLNAFENSIKMKFKLPAYGEKNINYKNIDR